MHPRASMLVAALGLLPHPEGGYFREIHRSPTTINPGDDRARRAALTVIYFLLADDVGGVSRWHRVASDEGWHFHEGDPIELFVSDPNLTTVEAQRLGPWAIGTEPVRVVPAGCWQAARCAGAFALVSCTVAPGFEFSDFELLRDRPVDADRFAAWHPNVASLV
jgi:uncharacterized protein